MPNDHQEMVCVHGTFWEHVSNIIDEGLWAGGVSDMSKRKMIHLQLVSRNLADGFRSDGLRANCEVMVYVDYQKAISDGMKFFVTTNGSMVTTGFDGNIPYSHVEYMVPAADCFDFLTEYDGGSAMHREGTKINESNWRATVSYIDSASGDFLSPQPKEGSEGDLLGQMADAKPKTVGNPGF